MKFLCPSCKAKYQIADEKVTGRSVRMKCRKCGFLIQVPSFVAPSSAPPAPEPPPEPAPAPAPVAPPPRAAAAPAKAAPTKGAPPAPSASRPAQVPKRTGAVPAPKPAPRVAPPPRAPARPAPAAPSGAARSPRPAAASTSLPGTDIPTPEPVAGLGIDGPADDEEATHIATAGSLAGTFAALAAQASAQAQSAQFTQSAPDASAGALAGAFTSTVGTAPAAPVPVDSAPHEEWFVGINGVPVGPIRLSELRSKAASGAVNGESLVWREGFEDWRPLKTFPELLAIVEESVASAQQAGVFVPVATAPGAGLGPGDALAAGLAGGAASPVAGGVVAEDLEAAGLVQRRAGSPAAWIAVVVAMMFGLTIGFVIFGRQKPADTTGPVAQATATAAPTGAAAANSGGPTQTAIEEYTVSGDPKAAAANKQKAAGTPHPTASAEPEPKPAAGLKGLSGLSGLTGSGPRGGPEGTTGSGSPGSGGGQLDASQIQSTVARYTNSVKRACWQPALDTRDKDAPTSARVVVTINVVASGSVQSASATEDPRGYRGLSTCIANRVRGWQFPPSGDSTTVHVPFVFAAQ